MGARKVEAASKSWLDLLNQDRWWRTAEGQMIRIDRMTPEHRLNLMAALVRNAPKYAVSNSHAALKASLSVSPDPSDGVFSAMYGWEGEADAAMSDPLLWMTQKPLYLAVKDAVVRDLELDVEARDERDRALLRVRELEIQLAAALAELGTLRQITQAMPTPSRINRIDPMPDEPSDHDPATGH